MENLDQDLDGQSSDELRGEVIRLRQAIRLHRDEKGHGRCWLDDARLYAVLPEQTQAETQLPSKPEFLRNCDLFWEDRQKPGEHREV